MPEPDDSGGAATMTRVRFAVDEAVRRETTLEKMASLQPAFIPDGVVTAGNSSQIVDGSAAVLVASEAKVSELGLEPRARFVSFGVVGVDPHLMLHGNPEASAKALAKAGLTWDEIDVIEVNEAFASVVSQFLADTGLQERYEAGDVNPNGGGISLGHPLGATGARITATLVSELERRNARYGLATMCIGFGQAIAGVIERVDVKAGSCALLAVAVVVSLPSAARASVRKCGSVSYTVPGTNGEGHAALNNLRARDVSCRIAREVARAFLEHHTPSKGWHATSRSHERHNTLSEPSRGSARVERPREAATSRPGGTRAGSAAST